ncbi:hypothetical protein P3L10_033351 [Capsicum annuum]
MGIMNSFINDIFEKLAQESSRLLLDFQDLHLQGVEASSSRYWNLKKSYGNNRQFYRRYLRKKCYEIGTSWRILAKHAVSEGTKVVANFTCSLRNLGFMCLILLY